MGLYTSPPSLREFKYDKPTLLVCWWSTLFCTTIILLRVAGRFVRTERLFFEDKVAAAAIIPLYLRMGCVHVILSHGTNNADFSGADLTDSELHNKAVASGLVLASRIFYAATLWVLKNTILEFLKRLTSATWQRSHEIVLVTIRWTLLVTFIGVVISDLAECQPFSHYWQVLPDPGGQCRQGYVQLITMATCNVVTDLMLVIFPISIIVTSNMSIKRKIQLVLLFSLSLSVVGVTLYRVPHIFWQHGRQQYRSLLASVELLFATASANALVLGSFVRDRGVKKQKFRQSSVADSMDRPAQNRRPTIAHRHWGSDEDLIRDVGMGVRPALREDLEAQDPGHYVPAPVATHFNSDTDRLLVERRRQYQSGRSEDSLSSHDPHTTSESSVAPRKLSSFDVGGMLTDSNGASSSSYRRESGTSSAVESQGQHVVPSASVQASASGLMRGSTALLQDLGALFSPLSARTTRSAHRNGTELQTIPQSNEETNPHSGLSDELELRDPGGLLS